MPHSFRLDLSTRPAHYRTPSPPRLAFEPLSPKAEDAPLNINSYELGAQQDLEDSSSNFGRPGLINHKHGGRSQDSMSFFADIALSTHPSSSYHHVSGNKRPADDQKNAAPPSKRARSEKLHSPRISTRHAIDEARPVTSHEHVAQACMSDAELLLGFSQTVRHTANRGAGTFTNPQDHLDLWAPEKTFRRHSSPTSFYHQLREASRGLETKSAFAHRNSHVQHVESEQWSRLPKRNDRTEEHHGDLTKDENAPPIFDLRTSELDQGSRSNQLDPQRSTISQSAGGSGHHEGQSVQDPVDKSSRTQPKLLVNQEFDIEGTPHQLSASGKGASSRKSISKDHSGGRLCTEADIADTEGTLLNEHGVGTESKSRSTQPTAICAACKFARNSSHMDGENNATSWISCDACKDWFHFACAGFKTEREVRSVDKFRCKKCKPIHGATTYVRKSSRAHSAIDYAGLHQGVLKTSDERNEHHYIQPIKDGIITFLPEHFARMHPDLVTAEFFEKSGGMREPIVIPADLNPRPESLLQETEPDKQVQPSETNPASSCSPLEEEAAANGFEPQYVTDDGQDALDMVIPQGLTVRHVAELYGPEEKVEVIDVKSQNGESKKWNMRRWADYYENPKNKVVRNVISLEVSQSQLGRLIRRPKVVRDLDLQDSVWPEDLLAKGEFPRVQFYCLMSVADCFTDFHIDFGGSSVFYHILKGKKTFLFIPPKEKHLKKYEEWCMSPAQNWTFLADQTKECYRVDLSEGDTMLIPSGWIHAVWTPEDSLVIGGNFLTRMNFGMQFRVAQVEKATGVARKFRYPHFQRIYWYTALQYLEEDPVPAEIKELLYGGNVFVREAPSYLDFDEWGENSRSGPENYHARFYSQPELDGLPDLLRYLLRMALIDLGIIADGVTNDARNAVRKSIPRNHGEPLDNVKALAAWSAWKRGNEPLPHWAYPDAEPESMVTEKLSAAAIKKLDREAAREAALQAPRRQSARHLPQQQKLPDMPAEEHDKHDCKVSDTALEQAPNTDHDVTVPSDPLTLEDIPKQENLLIVPPSSNRKTACDACRKRRRACKHKDQVMAQQNISSVATTVQQPVANSHPDVTEGTTIPVPDMGTTIEDGDLNAQQTPSKLPVYNPIHHTDQVQKALSSGETISSVDKTIEPSSASNSAMISRPRTKACNECRKSKRRCVHDAFGNEDPVKVAEHAIPRPHARKNRKASDHAPSSKLEEVENNVALEYPPIRAPVANMGTEPHSSVDTNPEDIVSVEESSEVQQDPSSSDQNHRVPEQADPSHDAITESFLMPAPAEMESSDINRPRNDAPGCVNVSGPRSQSPLDRDHQGAKDTEPGGPAAFLMSPPASSHDDIGNSPTNGASAHTPSPPTSRHASQQPQKAQPQQQTDQQQQRHTPESGFLRRASSSSFEPVHNMTTPGPTAAQLDETPGTLSQKPRARRASEAFTETDQDSLRLIKELQAQDLGLRRRGAR